VAEVYRGRDFPTAFALTKEAMTMPRMPDYLHAQFLLISAVLGAKPAKSAADALAILQKIFLASDKWSPERDAAFEECMVVVEEYRTAVGGQNRTKEAVHVARKVKKRSLEFLEYVQEVMSKGEQHERGDMILDVHDRLFEVVLAEMEVSLKVSAMEKVTEK
jgi:hypothetical protein